MAVILTTTGKHVFVPADRAKRYWSILNGELSARDVREQKLVSRIKRVYLSRLNAPERYLEENRHLISDFTPYRKQVVESRLPYKD
jgi:hypothetical protein